MNLSSIIDSLRASCPGWEPPELEYETEYSAFCFGVEESAAIILASVKAWCLANGLSFSVRAIVSNAIGVRINQDEPHEAPTELKAFAAALAARSKP